MRIQSTGNLAVDAMRKINITGNKKKKDNRYNNSYLNNVIFNQNNSSEINKNIKNVSIDISNNGVSSYVNNYYKKKYYELNKNLYNIKPALFINNTNNNIESKDNEIIKEESIIKIEELDKNTASKNTECISDNISKFCKDTISYRRDNNQNDINYDNTSNNNYITSCFNCNDNNNNINTETKNEVEDAYIEYINNINNEIDLLDNEENIINLLINMTNKTN